MRHVALVAYRAISDLAGKGSFFVITIAAAHRLSSEAFAVFSLASAFGWILAVATDFGIQLHVAREVARHPSGAAQVLGRWLTVRFLTAGLATILVVIGLAVSAMPGRMALPVLLFVCIYLIGGLVEFLNYFYRGLDRSDVESSLTLWQRPATLVAALAALAWRPSLVLLAAAMLLPALATFAFSLVFALRLGRRAMADARTALGAQGRAPIGRGPEFQRDVLPIGAGIVLSALYFRIDVFLIQRWAGTEPVGLYNAVFRLIEALRLFPAAVLAVVLPSLVRARGAQPLVRVSIAVTVFAVIATLVLRASASWLIPLVYGVRYAAAVPAFRILALSFPLLSLNYALTHQLIGWDQQRAYAVICGAALVANVGLNAYLIPAWSIEGAAWATFWTEVVLSAGCAVALCMNSGRGLSRSSLTAAC